MTSGVASPSQEVCLENDIIDIVYEFSGSANAVAFSVAGLPTGVTGNYTPRQQVSVIQINNTGVTVVSETYVINVNSVPYNFNAPIGSDEDDIGLGIANQIDGDPDVSASYDNVTNRITITANVAGDSFGIYIPSSTNTIRFNRPTLATSQGRYVIRGRPTNNVSGTFNYTLTTPGITCDPDIELGAIIVNPNSTIEIAAGTIDNQTICDGSVGDFVNMVYNIGGGARGIIPSGLPQGIVHVLDDPLNPTTVTLQGNPVTGDTGTNIYNFTLTTTANGEGCDEVSINGTITIEPNDTLTPSPTTAPAIIFNQEICIGEPMTPVVYEFSGGAIGASATGLPPGVNDSFVYRKQITSVRFTGPNINANEVYNVIIDNITHTVTSTAGQTPSNIVTDLIAVINAESAVASASNNGSILILTSLNDGQAFSFRTDKSAFAQLTIDPPVLENGTGILSITGTPTINAITAGQSSQSYTITVTTVNGNGCEVDIENPTIKVNSTSTISVTSLFQTLAQNVCLNQDIDPILFTIGGGATFAIDNGGLPLGVGLNPLGGNSFEIVGRPVVAIVSPTTYTFTVSTTGNGGGCDEASFTGTIIVSPDDNINLTSAATTTNQTICVGNDPSISQITTITYQLAGGATNASAAGLPAGIQTNYNPITKVFSIFGTSAETVTNTTTFNYTITTSGTCINASENGSIIVEPSAILSLTTVTATLNQTLCDNTAINNIEFDLVGSAVGAQVSGLPTGVNLNIIGLTAVISGSPATAALTPTTYSFTITATTISGCNVNSYSGEINVLPDDVLTLTSPPTSTSQEICVTNDPILSRITTITYQLSGGATSANFNGLPPGFGTIYNPVSKEYSIFGSTSGSTVTQTIIYNYTVTTSGTCAAQTEVGDITIVPIASLDVTSASSTLNQTICDGNNITPITFDFGGSATNASGIGLPLGVNLGPIVGNTITISGQANVNVLIPTTYTFTVTATGNGTCEEESFTGRIVVLPNDTLTHLSGDRNPTICNGNDPANPGMTPIIYQLGGGATSGIVTGLPNGLSFTYSATTRQLTIDGRPSLAIAVPTPYNYTITTIGSCASQTDSGIITVNPLSTISLSSAVSTTSQIGADSICMGDSIVEIFYTYGGGATSFSVSGLPAGVLAQATGNPNEVRIFGEPNTGSTIMELFTYTISTTGNPCAPETSLSGVIQVNPSPSIDSNFILNNDITHVTCNGGSDGSIVIPDASPAFDLRIFGGQNSVRQVDQLSITGNFNIGDRVHVIINGNPYNHIIEETAFGSGIVESNLSIASKLTDNINNAIPALAVPVTASTVAPGDIVLSADIAGVPFTVTFPVPPTQTLLNGDISNTNIVTNLPLNYNYLWTYPDNSTNTNLSIYNLQAGDYTFEVTLNGCSSGVASFTIDEPDTLTISTTSCNGAFTALVEGGTAPYTLTLFDSNNVQIDQVVTNSGKTYVGLTPGANYRLEVLDSRCAIMEQMAIELPFGLQYDDSRTRVVHDFCDEVPINLGGGSIELETTLGLAFSGGSNQFTYSWIGPNAYTNSTMNITNLLPGVYTVRVIDNIFNCEDTQSFTILPADPITVIPTGGTSPSPQAGVSSVADFKVDITCPGDTFTLEVQAQGGGTINHIYNWTRNGVAIAPGGANNQLTTSQPGIYNVEASIDLTGVDIPYQYTAAQMVCAQNISFEVVEPTVMNIVEVFDRRIIPACSGDTAQLVFEVVGGALNAGPYSLDIQNGALSGTSVGGASVREIVINGIDTNNLGQLSNYTITDVNGCSATATLSTIIELPQFQDSSFQIDGNNIDCANGEEGRIDITLSPGSTAPSEVGVQVSSTGTNFNYFVNWDNPAGGSISVPINQAGAYTVKVIGIPAVGNTSTITTVCDIYSGNIEIKESQNNQILLRNIETTQPGCGETLGSISLIFDEPTIPPTMSIRWEKFITTTTSSTSGTINSQDWSPIPSLDNQLIAPNLENGTYRGIIDPGNTQNGCDGGIIITRSIAIGNNSGIEILNPRYIAVNQNPSPCDDPDALRYNLLFRVDNNLDNFSGNLEITVNKISSVGNPYSQTFQTNAVGQNGISIPGTQDKSGAYRIDGVPFGEFEILISESGGATDTTSCDVVQTILIPEVVDLVYTGDLQFEIDPCIQEVFIEAFVEGGQPFISPNGDTFYRYQWILTTTDNEIFNYSGKNIIVRDAGNLQLTVFDSSGCEYTIIDQTSPIEINEGISPYRLEPRLNNNTEFAEEPTCDNPLRDNGQINFDVVGGDLPQGGQYPYEITWEKFDVGTNSYLEMNGNSGLPNLANQEFANNLIPGQYKISVVPINWSCVGQSPFDTVAISKVITIPQNQDLVITNGPFIDVSEYDFTDPTQLTICDVGGAGNLYVKVFNNYDGDLTFYYPNETDLVPAEQLDGQSYRVQISQSVADGVLTVTNDEGCRLSVNVGLEIGEPSYNYNSLNAQISGNSTETQLPLILAREEVTFTNTSTGTFTYLEWDFGDSSPLERYSLIAGTSSPVSHIYGVSGTYYPKLRVYNSVGCYKETVKVLVVGKGYSILAPNVFTPNGDTYNDTFRPLFSGFQSIQLTIYDYRGNLLYTEESNYDPANPLQPITLTGWEGDINTESPYYIYSVYGVTLFGNTEIQKSGTFVMIR